MKKITTWFEVVPIAVALQSAKLVEDQHVEEECIEESSSPADAPLAQSKQCRK